MSLLQSPFVCGLHLRLTKPQWQHVLRIADALIVSEARHKTIAGLYRLMVEAPDPSNGADGYPLKAGHPLEGFCQEGKHPPYTPFCIFLLGYGIWRLAADLPFRPHPCLQSF